MFSQRTLRSKNSKSCIFISSCRFNKKLTSCIEEVKNAWTCTSILSVRHHGIVLKGDSTQEIRKIMPSFGVRMPVVLQEIRDLA
jgi:hypothetical protein